MATGGGERTARRAAIALLVVVTANTLGTRAAYNASCAAHSAYMAAPQLADGSAPVVATVAGGAGHGISGFGNGHALRSALLNFPGGLLVHPATGTVLVADNQNQRVRALSTDGTMTTFAGSGSTGSSDNTNPLLATFNEPAGVVLDLAADVLFVSEQAGHVIRRVAGVVDGAGAVSTYAGTGAGAYLDASRLSARFKAPNGLALDESRQILYVADRTNGRIRIVNLTSGDVSTERSGLSDPTDVKVHPLTPRYLYVTCFSGQTVIRRDVISGAEFTVTSSIGYTIGVAVAFAAGPSGSDVLFVSTGHRVYRINGDGTGTAVLAGGASSGLTNGSAASARFTSPTGIAIDTASGSLIVADTGNNALRTITHATAPCRQSTASRSPTASLTAPRSRTRSPSRSPSPTVARTRSSSVTVLRTPSHTTSLSRGTRHPSATHSHTLAQSLSALATASRGNSTLTASKASPTVTATATPRPAFNTTTSPPATTTTSPAAPTAAVTTPPPPTSTAAAGPSSSPASTTSSPTPEPSPTNTAPTAGPTTAVVSTTGGVSSPPSVPTDRTEGTLLPTPSPPATTPRETSTAPTPTPMAHATSSTTTAATGTPPTTHVPSPPNVTAAVSTDTAPSTAAVTDPATPLLRTTLTFRLSGDRWRHALALRGSYVRDAVVHDLASAYEVANATRDVEVSNVTVGSLVVAATVSHSLTNRSSASVLRDAPFHRTIAEYADAGAADAASVTLLEVDAVDTLWSVPVPPPTNGVTAAPDDDASSNPVAALFDDCGVTCVALLVVCGLVVAAIVAAAVAVVVASMRRADDTSRPSSAGGIGKDAASCLDADASLPCDVEGDSAASASGRAASNPLILVAPPLNLGSDGEFSDRETDADGGGSRRLRFNVAKNSVVLYDPKSPASPLMSLDGSERPGATRGAPDVDDAAQHSIGGARSSTSAEDSSTSSARAYLDLRSPPPPPPEQHRPFDVHTALMVTHAPRSSSSDARSGVCGGRFRLPRRAATDDSDSAAPRVHTAPRPAFAEEADSPVADAPMVADAPLPPPPPPGSAASGWANASVDSLEDDELPPQSPTGVVLTFATPPPGPTPDGR